MIITICAAIILARIRGYRARYLFHSWTIYPVLMAQCTLIFLQGSVFFTYSFVRFAALIQMAIIASFLFAVLHYRIYKPAVIGASCTLLGTLLNKFAIAQNGGKMPVYPGLSLLTGYVRPGFEVADDLHVLGSAATKYKFLADFLDVGYSVLSVGDILIHLFTFILLYYSIKAADIQYGKQYENNCIKYGDD